MVTAMLIVAGAVLMHTLYLLLRQSEFVRRLSLATCGVMHIAIGITAAAVLTLSSWSGTSLAWASDGRTVGGEEIFFEEAIPISVEPGKTVIIPPGRPQWIAEYKSLERPWEADWSAVVSGPFKTRMECEKELSAEVKKAADDYMNNYLGSKFAAKLLAYDGADLKNRLVKPNDLYAETITVSFGPMEQIHARVDFTEDFRRELDQKWHEIKAKWRLAQVGLVGAVVLGLLSTAFGFFKATTASRGQRGASLQMAAAATILVIVVAGVSAARYLYWF